MVARLYKHGTSEKYSYFKENVIYFSLMLTILLTYFINTQGCSYETIILMFSTGEYVYNFNRNWVNNICYFTCNIIWTKSQTKKKESYENTARCFTDSYSLKYAVRFPDLRSFSHKNYFWNTKNWFIKSISQILKRYFKPLC